MGRLLNIYIQRMISYLSQEGMKIVSKAQATKQRGNQTYNQADAFGYVVYYNGKAVRQGYANTAPQSKATHHGWAKYNIPDGTGRSWLNDFIQEYKPPTKDFALLIVNAAFYSAIQEKKYKYQIISQTFGALDQIAAKFDGAEVNKTL